MTASPVAMNFLMDHAAIVGSMMAEKFLTHTPPPWEESWFEFAYGHAVAAAADTFKTNWPDLSETELASMQVQYCDGFEVRMREVLSRLQAGEVGGVQ